MCVWSCQVSSLRQDLQVKEKQYEVRLQAIEDSHRHSALELREMLTAQQQMSAKYVLHSSSLGVTETLSRIWYQHKHSRPLKPHYCVLKVSDTRNLA